MPQFSETVAIALPWSDWLFLIQQRDVGGGGGFHIHNPWGNSNQPQGGADRNRLEIGYRTAQGQDLWGQLVIHGPSGNVGIGTVAPAAKLEVRNGWQDWIFLRQQRDVGGGGGFHIHNPWGNSNQPQGSADRNRLEIGYRTPQGQDLWGQVVIHGPSGNVGIGTVAPQARLHVGGNMLVDGDIGLRNADLAEQFPVRDLDHPVEGGTVMVLDGDGGLRVCDQPYDKRAAGVVSGAGDYRPAVVLDKEDGEDARRITVALMGKVACKVDATFSRIEVGDLLTTSETPGHAMKASDASRAFGATIGKAMRPLERGKGLIPILAALQ